MYLGVNRLKVSPPPEGSLRHREVFSLFFLSSYTSPYFSRTLQKQRNFNIGLGIVKYLKNKKILKD